MSCRERFREVGMTIKIIEKIVHCKKGCKLFPARETPLSDIHVISWLGTGQTITYVFLQCSAHKIPAVSVAHGQNSAHLVEIFLKNKKVVVSGVDENDIVDDCRKLP